MLRVVPVDAELVAGGAQLVRVHPLEEEADEEVDGRHRHGEARHRHHAALVVHALCVVVNVLSRSDATAHGATCAAGPWGGAAPAHGGGGGCCGSTVASDQA